MKRNSSQQNLFGTWKAFALSTAIMLMTIGSINGKASVAQAQTVGPFSLNSVVYAAKFVCGFKPGFTPPQELVISGTAGLYNYRDFEPGSYATALNVLFATGANNTTNINVFVSVPETSQNSALRGVHLGPLSISNFGTVKVDCEDIAQALNGPLPQVADKEVIEGFLYITRPADDLIVEAVYSYSSYYSSQNGGLGGETVQAGIGLGSSIHVQNIEPKTYSIRFPGVIKRGPIQNHIP